MVGGTVSFVYHGPAGSGRVHRTPRQEPSRDQPEQKDECSLIVSFPGLSGGLAQRPAMYVQWILRALVMPLLQRRELRLGENPGAKSGRSGFEPRSV